jgi:hypothetical protein
LPNVQGKKLTITFSISFKQCLLIFSSHKSKIIPLMNSAFHSRTSKDSQLMCRYNKMLKNSWIFSSINYKHHWSQRHSEEFWKMLLEERLAIKQFAQTAKLLINDYNLFIPCRLRLKATKPSKNHSKSLSTEKWYQIISVTLVKRRQM